MSYLMTPGGHDCGPQELAEITGKPLAEVKRAMRWADYNDIRDDLNDNPAGHFIALQRLGVPYRVVTCGQVIRGECKPNGTAILIHGQGILGSWLAQHWIVLKEVSATHVTCWLGDGSAPSWTLENFQKAYSRGGPTATAYEVYPEAPKPLTRWAWLGNLISKLFGKRS